MYAMRLSGVFHNALVSCFSQCACQVFFTMRLSGVFHLTKLGCFGAIHFSLFAELHFFIQKK